MNKIIFTFLVSSLSVSFAYAENDVHKNISCISTDKTYIAPGSDVADDIKKLEFDPSVDVTIEYSGKVCSSSGDVSVMSIPAPNSSKAGDTRVITQTRGHWVYTYTQIFTSSGGWMTTQYNVRYIGPDAMDL
ncbi:MAG: hypothetical protein V5788_06625 [Shewanella sp.]